MENLTDKRIEDVVIEKGLLGLLVFTPAAFGTVEAWSTAIFELVSFVLFGVWIFSAVRKETFHFRLTPLLLFCGLFVLIAAAQLLPLPRSVISAIAPEIDRLYTIALGPGDTAWRTLSVKPSATVDELWKVLAYCAVFTVIIHHYTTKNQIKTVAQTIIAVAVALVVFAIVQKMTWSGSLYWLFPVPYPSGVTFIWGPFINHNHFAGYLEMAFPIALGLVLYRLLRRRTSRDSISSDRSNLRSQTKDALAVAFPGLAVIIIIAGLTISLSRGALLGTCVSVILFSALVRMRSSLRKRARILGLTAFAVMLVLLAAAWDRIERRFDVQNITGARRAVVWSDSLDMIEKHPVAGTGFGTFSAAYPAYQSRYSTIRFDHAENDYIEIAAETGLPGLVVFCACCALFFAGVARSWRRSRSMFAKCLAAGGISSCAAILVHAMTDFNFRIPSNALLAVVIAGITYAAVSNPDMGAQTHERT